MRKYLASVDGLQDTYTMRFGCMLIVASKKSTSQPLLGGSTTTTSGANPWTYHQSITISAAPTNNSASVLLFIFASSFASAIASGTISTPYTFFAFWARNNEIVPMPQYASTTTSSGSSWAYSNAFSYKTSVCFGFT